MQASSEPLTEYLFTPGAPGKQDFGIGLVLNSWAADESLRIQRFPFALRRRAHTCEPESLWKSDLSRTG